MLNVYGETQENHVFVLWYKNLHDQ